MLILTSAEAVLRPRRPRRKTKRIVPTRAETGSLRATLVILAPRRVLARPRHTLVAVEAARVVVLLTLGILMPALGIATVLPR